MVAEAVKEEKGHFSPTLKSLSLALSAAARWRSNSRETGLFGPSMKTLFMGLSAAKTDDGSVVVSLAAHDETYLVDFTIKTMTAVDGKETGAMVADYVISEIQAYELENFAKFAGAALPTTLDSMSPNLCSRLWLELDIVPIVLHPDEDRDNAHSFWDEKHVDEQADSMARKCLMHFGPSLTPLLQVGWRGAVLVDAAFRAKINSLEDHRKTCGESTWKALTHHVNLLKAKKTKIAFFSSTPQGGGVALMRHALVRFSKLEGVDLTWYVPKPRPGVFRSTKDMHNILQGVAEPGQRLSFRQKSTIKSWIQENAERYWFSRGGPLLHPSEGGADIIVVDDPQMPGIIPMIKKLTPNRPVLYRSHIQIRGDLVAQAGSPQAEAWEFLWDDIRHADMFISHPVPAFVPHNIPREMVVYMPATTDWLDGLNKPLKAATAAHYIKKYNLQCAAQHMTPLDFPKRHYIVQIARFDPAKGIDCVIDSYALFRKSFDAAGTKQRAPQLVVAGNSSVDDPDATIIYAKTLDQISTHYPELTEDISVMRLDANDQMLNALISQAHVVLQLSTREGFEVKISEALHAGRPVISTFAGGMPLQVKAQENAFLVEPGDAAAVAKHLTDLFADQALWDRMSLAARTGVSDEVGTPGNALAWYYLAAKWSEVGAKTKDGAPGLVGAGKWVNDMARQEAGVPYEPGENRLPRKSTM